MLMVEERLRELDHETLVQIIMVQQQKCLIQEDMIAAYEQSIDAITKSIRDALND